MQKFFPILALGLFALPATAQVTAQRTVPLDGAAVDGERVTQAAILAGELDLWMLRRKGLEMFSLPFNQADGYGDGPVNPVDPLAFGGRPTINGTWLRINGLDAQSCLECHAVLSNATVPPLFGVGGVGTIATSAMPGVTRIDAADEDGSGRAETDGRMINPPFLFGGGGVELVGKEMTRDLQALRQEAYENPGTPVRLVAKGIDFGELVVDAETGRLDASRVEGIDADLVVRPFGRKGEFHSLRAFDVAAMEFHFGMQPVEVVGEGVDGDGDGVYDEVLVGELSALHAFGASLERPFQVGGGRQDVRRGRRIFSEVGCAGCHTPSQDTESPLLGLAFPEDPADPSANVFLELDLENGTAGFRPNRDGGIRVPLFSDLKRHDMGPELAETTGSELDSLFLTPRLWGVADTAPYLHDGRALTLREAIELHGGEGAEAAAAFDLLPAAEQADLLRFLSSLRVPRQPARDLQRANHGDGLAHDLDGRDERDDDRDRGLAGGRPDRDRGGRGRR